MEGWDKMGKCALFTLLVGGLFLIAGCSSAKASSIVGNTPTPTETPTLQATASPGPTVVPSPQPEVNTLDSLTSTCDLLDSRDVSLLFSSAEHEGPVHSASQVNHLIFSTEAVSATEVSCVFYVFYPPGYSHRQVLQVTYWLDVPGQAAPDTWAQVWADAKSKAAQTVSGVGNDAFYNGGRLTFKQDNVYVTLEIIGTSLNTDTKAGVSQQVQWEKQIALDVQGNLNRAEK